MDRSSVEPKRQEAETPQAPKRRPDPYRSDNREEFLRDVAEQSARNHPGLTVEKALEMLEGMGF